MAPHIAATVPSESATQTAGAVTVTTLADTGGTTERVAKVIAAKTIASANITRAGRVTRIGVSCEVPRGYVALASHSRSCEHGCGDQCSRQKFKLSHSISPKANSVWLLLKW